VQEEFYDSLILFSIHTFLVVVGNCNAAKSFARIPTMAEDNGEKFLHTS
jgi:hypothetical protein